MLTEQNQSRTAVLDSAGLLVGITLGINATILIGVIALVSTGTRVSLPATLQWQEPLLRQARLMGLPLQGETSAYWYMSRISALLAYLFIWGATVWGLLLSTKIAKPVLSPLSAFGIHEFLSFLGLGFAAFHALILLGDRYIQFNLGDILIPFAASYKPIQVGVGIISLYLYALIIFSFYIKRKISHKVWRSIHYLTFLTYLMILAHGLLAGSDSTLMFTKIMYTASAAAILFLLYYRILISATQKTSQKEV